MRPWLRSTLAILLALILTLTGQSMAVARGMPNAAGEIVLCTGYGPVAVLVDDQGQPVGPPHICPDCALSFFDLVPPGFVQLMRPATRAMRLGLNRGAASQSRSLVPSKARDPPFFA